MRRLRGIFKKPSQPKPVEEGKSEISILREIKAQTLKSAMQAAKNGEKLEELHELMLKRLVEE